MLWNKIVGLMFFTIVLLFIASCGGGGNVGSKGNQATDSISSLLIDPLGNPISQVDHSDPVVASFSGLTANSKYFINIKDSQGNLLNPVGGFIVTSDEDGVISEHTLIQNIGSNVNVATPVITRNTAAAIASVVTGQYSIDVINSSGNIVNTLNFIVGNTSSVSCTDSSKIARASFLATEDVFINVTKNNGTLSDGSYDVYVMSDLNPVLMSGDILINKVTTVAVTNGSGSTTIGKYPSGVFDVIIDINNNGQFDIGTDLISRHHRLNPCFTIQTANTGLPIVGQICSDRYGNYRDVFDPKSSAINVRNMYAYITPTEQSLVQETLGVGKYVVAHQNNWVNGDKLTDVTAGIEIDPVQGFCTNESPWLIWPRQLQSGGCYDVVVDINRNGVFDAGIDFVDNIDVNGDPTCGCRVAELGLNTVIINSHTDGQSVDSTAITITGIISGAPVSSSIIISSGTQSNTIPISVVADGTFSAKIPLFFGLNSLTIYGIYANKSAVSQTISLTSTQVTNSNQLFRVQLTWGGNTDMDLHLVKPAGSFDDNITDCNFLNCNVGLAGTGVNVIDWGLAGNEDDDPKLDVDCIACGNGIENIWMNEITDDGLYTIYINAYTGKDVNVTATLFIKGNQVGQVNCGNMEDQTVTKICRVGTINWLGGSSGNGHFTPDGTKAAIF